MHFQSIQVLRAAAALLVVGFHTSEGSFLAGAAGVDVFFVISGYIMGTVGARERAPDFMLKRLIRIVPLYWLVTLIMCVAAVFGLMARFTFGPTALMKSLLFIPYFDPAGNVWPLVVVGWTLNAEMLFYVVFSVGILLGAPILASSLIIVLLVLAGRLVAFGAAPLQLWTTPILLEFVAGLALASWLRPAGTGRGLLMIAAGILILGLGTGLGYYQEAYRLVLWGLPALLLVAGALAIERAGAWPAGLKPFEALGDASYSLYLLHGLVLAFAHRLLGLGWTATAIGIVTAVAVSLVSYRMIEQPLSQFLRRAAFRRSKASLPTVAR